MYFLIHITEMEEGVEHLANAVVICGQGQHLMQVFTQTLPPEVVTLLTVRIPMVRQVGLIWYYTCIIITTVSYHFYGV